MRSSGTLQRAGTVLLLLAILPLALVSFRWLQAELLFWQTSQLFGKWESREADESWDAVPGQLALEEWETARQRLVRAHRLHPGQGRYHELQSRLALWRIHTPWQRDQAQSDYTQALVDTPLLIVEDMLEQAWLAALAKPSWPYGWLEVAVLHGVYGVYDTRFAYAVTQTLQYGGKVRDVRLQLARLVISQWEVMIEALNENALLVYVLLANLQATLASDSPDVRQVLAIMREHQTLDLICAQLARRALHPQARQACGWE